MNKRRLLNKGFVRLDNHSDNSDLSNISKLYEQVSLRFHIKAPVFIAKQFLEVDNSVYTEFFYPFSVVKSEYYIPVHFKVRNTVTGEDVTLPEEQCNQLYTKFENFHKAIYGFYKKLLDQGIKREQANIILPQSMYVEFYWSIDLKSFEAFLKEILADTSQYEMHQYAEAFMDVFLDKLPEAANFFTKKNTI